MTEAEEDPTEDEIEEQAARMFYRLEGWEKFWPYEKRPQWLRVKYP